MANKLYVGNLSFDTTESDLQELFASAGSVKEAALVTDKFTGNSRGFAFVTMATDEEAQKAVSQFNGKDFMGRDLTVNEARPREDFGGGGGGGGGGGARKKSFGGDRGGSGGSRGGSGGGGNRRY